MSPRSRIPRPDARTVEDVVLLLAAIPLLLGVAAVLTWRRARTVPS